MIRKISDTDIEFVNLLLENNKYQNPYLYIDAMTFGWESADIDTWIIENCNNINGVLYRYYNSLQICIFNKNYDIQEISEFIRNKNFNMISAASEVILEIEKKLDNYVASTGVIMIGDVSPAQLSNKTELAGLQDCHEIACLICSDEGIGGHYSIQLLTEQLQNRMRDWNCINVILKSDNKIVCHMATYAICNEMAILGGFITEERYRGFGYGKTVLSDLTYHVVSDGKIPLLYCYNQNVVAWYERNGWKSVSKCGKLEKRI